MNNMRLINAPLEITFEKKDQRYDIFKREYDSLSEFEEDSVGQWLKLAKARGETKESDTVLLTLLIELHKKVDELTRLVKEEEVKLLELEKSAMVESIGFEHIKTESAVFETGVNYYARITMPLFPKREAPVFIKAISNDIVKIEMIHDKDQKDWNAYVAARERVKIREMKGNNGN